MRIEAIGFEEKVYGPLVGYFSMEQNMISAQQFDLNLGTTGLAEGEMYFDVYPAHLQLGFLTRLTALNLVEVLPKKYLPKIPAGDKNVSGRSGIVVNLRQGSIDGRVDITEIGGSQLITLINVLDPKYEDDKMNMARTALGVGAPTFVEMSFQKGYMDMGMDLSVLGVTQRYDVRGIPLSTMVASATEELVKEVRGGSIKMIKKTGWSMLALLAAMVFSSCTAKIYVQDRHTILEEEAAGEWPGFEREIVDKSKEQGPTALQKTETGEKKKRLYNVLNGEMTGVKRGGVKMVVFARP